MPINPREVEQKYMRAFGTKVAVKEETYEPSTLEWWLEGLTYDLQQIDTQIENISEQKELAKDIQEKAHELIALLDELDESF